MLYGINKGVLNKLQKVQNAAVRLVFRKRKRDGVTITTTLFHKLHWLRIEDRIIFKILLIVYKCLRGMAPLNLINLLIINFDAEYTLHTPNFNTIHGRRSFTYIAPRLWNEIPTAYQHKKFR